MKRLLSLAGLALLAQLLFACTPPQQHPPPSGSCLFNDECGAGQVCAGGRCRTSCRTDRDCANNTRCRPSEEVGLLVCLGPEDPQLCAQSPDCHVYESNGSLLLCLQSRCVSQCESDFDCQILAPGSTCQRDRALSNYGACVPLPPPADAGCADGGTSCNGACVDLQSNTLNCGACSQSCRSLPGTEPDRASCVRGACDLTNACAAGRANCDNMASNGCETSLVEAAHCGSCVTACGGATPFCALGSDGAPRCVATCPSGTMACSGGCVDTSTSPAHCGACGNACPAGAHSVARCAAGSCGLTCAAGWADCDRDPSNGCEVNLRSSASNCGACGTACPSGAGATGVCAGGTCALQCTAGRADCDGMAANGCEADTQGDATNCGACANRCAGGAHATGVCARGACGLQCATGFGDCDGDPANGCETDVSASGSHCGRCGNACAAGPNGAPSCAAGACTLRCDTGFADCDGMAANGCEAATLSDARNCGACGRACPSGAGAAAACVAGSCGLQCMAGRADCDGMAANGCEVDTQGDATNCGACANRCAGGAEASCAAGACGLSCRTGFGNCDGMAANGCEVDLRSSASNCGGCGVQCVGVHGTASCSAGACMLTSCSAGYGDCDRSTTNGCETDLSSSAANCGLCGRACPGPTAGPGSAVCATGSCSVLCATGFSLSGTVCVPLAPRLVAPLTAQLVNRAAPRLSFVPVAAAEGVRVQVCRDRACAIVLATADRLRPATTWDLPSGLAPGVYFWRAASLLSGAAGTWSAPWSFRVPVIPTRTVTAPPSAWGSTPDLNGDGYPELLVHDPLSGGNLRVYAYFGSAAGLVAPPTTVHGVAAMIGGGTQGAQDLCAGVGSVGDVNGDGFTDLVVSQNVTPGLGGGTALYFVRGAATGLPADGSQTSYFYRPPVPTGSFGAVNGGEPPRPVISGLGDVNGDGYADFAVANRVLPADWDLGEVHVFLGSAAGPVTPPTVLYGLGMRGFGNTVYSAGDVNGDGLGDWIVPASHTGGTSYSSEQVALYLGRLDGVNPLPALVWQTPSTTGGFGVAAGPPGDVNGDGYSDIVLGSYAGNTTDPWVDLYFGGPGLPSRTPNVLLARPSTSNATVPSSVSAVGDLDGDGYAELLVTVATGPDSPVFVYRGGALGPAATPTYRLSLPANTAYNLTDARDFDGDGLADVAFGVPNSAAVSTWHWDTTASALVRTQLLPAVSLTGDLVATRALRLRRRWSARSLGGAL